MTDADGIPLASSLVAVVTADQRGSRVHPDLVPDTLSSLDEVGARHGFERTVGDELQGVVDRPEMLTAVVERLLRGGQWHIGIGVGRVEDPPPASTREGRGEAYVRAREAVTAAKSAPAHLRVVGDEPWARWLESSLWLWAALLSRRTAPGWVVADLVDAGSTYGEVAREVGVTPGAISHRAQAAGIAESRRARELATGLAARALAGAS